MTSARTAAQFGVTRVAAPLLTGASGSDPDVDVVVRGHPRPQRPPSGEAPSSSTQPRRALSKKLPDPGCRQGLRLRLPELSRKHRLQGGQRSSGRSPSWGLNKPSTACRRGALEASSTPIALDRQGGDRVQGRLPLNVAG